MKSLIRIENLFDRFIRFIAHSASFLFIGVMLIVCLEIFMRYFINRPLTWVVEVAEFTLLYISFLGIAWLLREESHVKIEMLLIVLSSKGQAFLNFITSIIGAATCLTLVVYGTQATWIAYQIGRTTRTAMMVKQWPLLIIMPIGFFLLFLQFLRRTRDYHKEWRLLQGK